MIHLDTHIVAWLYDARTDLFRQETLDLMRGDSIVISPMVEIELQFLREIGRLKAPASVILQNLQQTLNLAVAPTPFADVVAHAREMAWTRDPFDRIIVGQAQAERASLVTRDSTILANYDLAVW